MTDKPTKTTPEIAFPVMLTSEEVQYLLAIMEEYNSKLYWENLGITEPHMSDETRALEETIKGKFTDSLSTRRPFEDHWKTTRGILKEFV